MIYKKHGRYYVMEFWFNGRRYQKSTRTENRRVAEDIERAFRTNLARGEVGIEDKPATKPPTVGGMLDRLQADYEARGKGSEENLSLFRVVKKAFGHRVSLTDDDITAYVTRLRKQGKANSTVNNHLQVLAQAYKLAKLPAPAIPSLSTKDNVRTGFLRRAQFDVLYAALPVELRDYCLFGYLTGWRTSAVKNLQWSDVRDGQVFLRGKLSKNGRPYCIPLNRELAELIERRRQNRAITTPSGVVIAHLVFHRDGKLIVDYRKAWATACRAAGCEGTIPHDMRRSAARNLIRAGVPRGVAKNITGHETDTIFERYNITDADDLTDAVNKLDRYQKAEQQKVVAIGG
jgi:integrase